MALTRDELMRIRENLQAAVAFYRPTDRMMRSESGLKIAAFFKDQQEEIKRLLSIIDRELLEIGKAEAAALRKRKGARS